MAQQARSQAVAVRNMPMPKTFSGTPTQWRVLTEAIWPGAKSVGAVELALAYCGARHLDPFKRPVHIVPVWNSALNRVVETVWPGINELLTTASRTQGYAGLDSPKWGPYQTHTFAGEGGTSTKLTFPVSCEVTVWRLVGGQRVAFSVPVYWMEAYARASHKVETPNAMWRKRPMGQLHKCAMAASLRAAFPEEVGHEYAAEEMEGRTIAEGGVTIDGEASTAEAVAGLEADKVPGGGTGEEAGTTGSQLAVWKLDESTGTKWLRDLQGLLNACADASEVADVAGHATVAKSLADTPENKTPVTTRAAITAMLKKAHDRFPADEAGEEEWDDPVAPLVADLEVLTSADDLDALPNNIAWRTRVAGLMPLDQDRVADAIEARKAALKGDTP